MTQPCPHCGCLNTVYVHGHEQCVQCKNNIAPCCDGEIVQEFIEDYVKKQEEKDGK